ncbi:hypothetical protein CW768_11590 [Listeria monocytogenes]|uniref:hypothetical protein n=1 Tax=Listeria monocytogenes TaxID=1639 RepID=UPI00085246A8|nr:hypothetical protein [Listeria monocytogenes]EAF4458031.1 hypothetical protein [Listeria monocytogenes serotype 1/2a]EAC2500105.1 hypothetical protein [Listeria monocytogenes]EAC8094075.1 hypothetical protein [Listeria monocytogenes]EAC9888672.1 hypothetical protein [Listeria monocytogenes]EAD1969777.1 hypothetical protein [Listeria monocytogenes]
MKSDKLVLSINKRKDATSNTSEKYDIKLGDWNLKKGVRSIQLDMTAGNPPLLIIECLPELIEIDGLKVEPLIKKVRRQ